jgi:hypothetical protein
MSGLEHDEDAATLAEALAFVDEFTLPPVDLGTISWRPIDAGYGSCSPIIEVKQKPKPKRVRDPLSDARRRQRRKEEREALRQQVKDLERVLGKIRRAFRPRSAGSDSTDGDDSDRQRVTKRTALRWHKALVEEHRRRCEAEKLNTELRSSAAAQAKTLKALEQCLKQSAEMPGVAWPAPSPFLAAPALPKIITELQTTVQQLYHEACGSCDLSLPQSVSRDFSVRSDQLVGTYCEARATTPLGRSLVDVAALMKLVYLRDKFPITPEGLQPGKVSCIRVETATAVTNIQLSTASCCHGQVTALVKQLVMDMAVDGNQMRFHCVFLINWTQESDRVVLTFSSLLFHPSGAFCFREGGWTIVQQSPDNTSECMSQFCVRVAPQRLGDDGSTSSRRFEQEQAVGMSVLSSKAQIKSEQIQHRLLLTTGREDLARMLPAPRPADAISWSAQTMSRSIRVLGAAK